MRVSTTTFPVSSYAGGQPGWPDRLLAFYARWRILLWIGLIAAYIGAFSTIWRPEPDAALYLSTARNLVRGLGYTYQGEVNTLAWPGYPYLLAGVFRIFGTDNLAAAHIVSLLMALAFLAMVYRLFWLHGGPGLAMVITGMTGLSQLVFRQAFQLRNDMPFAMGVMAFLAGYEALHVGFAVRTKDGELVRSANPTSKIQNLRRSLVVFGLAWAILMRPNGWILLAVVGAALLWRRPGRWQLAGLLAAAVLAALTFIYLDPRNGGTSTLGSYEAHLRMLILHPREFVQGSLWPNARKMFEPILVESTLGMEMLVGLNTFWGIVALILGVGLIRLRPLWGLWVLAMVGCLLIEPVGRYVLAIMPLLAYGWWRGCVWWTRRLLGRWGNLLFAGALAFWVVPNAWEVLHIMGKQRQIVWVEKLSQQGPLPYEEICGQLRGYLPAGTYVLAPRDRSRVFSYLLDRVTLEAGDIGKKIIPTDALIVAVIPDAGNDRDELMTAIHDQGWRVKKLLAVAKSRGRPDWRAFRIDRPMAVLAAGESGRAP